MKKEVSPLAAAIVIGVIVLIAGIFVWKGTQKQETLPKNANSGPIVLPASQQGRKMPQGTFSGATSLPGANGH